MFFLLFVLIIYQVFIREMKFSYNKKYVLAHVKIKTKLK